ncbi:MULTISPECIES: hypothetical protein [Acinetobacter calcoaceticus/baumannii complex]|uniref:hypothetical protein n=1 Tax=Acinetobacter calcoaceticus/baumannii complex TaxID=909768 RepID=UPI00070D27B1|nr:hypothetical protein [Acinetobacter baumannii]KRI03950.1 hypothetical protein APC85_13905 [Acinetobacter baumannii]KRI08181.1 hypothetical protein APC63_04345 [Acinetobacter baumannii]KRI73896.1 hypothetical protein APC65_00570 [Acinetobacter baumannii]
MTNTFFPSQLTEDMYNNSVYFHKILHVPTLGVADHVSEDFEEFLWDMDAANATDLIEKHPQLQEYISHIQLNTSKDWFVDHANDLARDHSNLEFLIELYIAIPKNISLTEDGKFSSCSFDGYRCQWIFAIDMKDAAEQGIKLAERMLAEKVTEARVKQGLESQS